MSYRTADIVMQERIEAAERDIAALDREIAARRALLDFFASQAAFRRERLAREGPGGGEAGARFLRIPIIVSTMLALATLVLPVQWTLVMTPYGRPAQVAAYAITSLPLVLGTAVASRHRAALRPYFVYAMTLVVISALVVVCSVGGPWP